jgi:hypothetical protein
LKYFSCFSLSSNKIPEIRNTIKQNPNKTRNTILAKMLKPIQQYRYVLRDWIPVEKLNNQMILSNPSVGIIDYIKNVNHNVNTNGNLFAYSDSHFKKFIQKKNMFDKIIKNQDIDKKSDKKIINQDN